MKKKYNEIVVKGKKYTWTVNVDGDGSNELKIFLDEKVLYETLIPGHIVITPSMVKKKIVNILL